MRKNKFPVDYNMNSIRYSLIGQHKRIQLFIPHIATKPLHLIVKI